MYCIMHVCGSIVTVSGVQDLFQLHKLYAHVSTIPLLLNMLICYQPCRRQSPSYPAITIFIITMDYDEPQSVHIVASTTRRIMHINVKYPRSHNCILSYPWRRCASVSVICWANSQTSTDCDGLIFGARR